VPGKDPNPLTVPSGQWTSREAYLLALACLMGGILIGYVFRGPAAPTLQGVAAGGVNAAPAPNAKSPATVQDLQPLAAPLLAALKVDPKNADTLVQLGNLYFDHQTYPEAIEYYSRALEVRPKDVNVRTDLGTAYWYSGFPERAAAEYEKSLAVDPRHTNTLFNLGVVRLEGLKDPAGAIAALEKLLEVNPAAAQRNRALELMARARAQKR
jgi:tetratricopeptide (TPR) repeat protein